MEIWKKVPLDLYREKYLISNEGRLKNAKTGKVHAINLDSDGYPHYLLCANGNKKTITAHRLVALAFVENPLQLPCVNHKDEVKTNNSAANLEWCSVKYNNDYGTRKRRAAERCSVPVEQMKDGGVVATFSSALEAHIQTGIDYSKIRMCCRKERITAGGYQWRNKENEND